MTIDGLSRSASRNSLDGLDQVDSETEELQQINAGSPPRNFIRLARIARDAARSFAGRMTPRRLRFGSNDGASSAPIFRREASEINVRSQPSSPHPSDPFESLGDVEEATESSRGSSARSATPKPGQESGYASAGAKASPLIGIAEEIDTFCAVCLEEVSNPDDLIQNPDCGHQFCKTCLTKWLKSPVGSRGACPLCRGSISPNVYDELGVDPEEDPHDPAEDEARGNLQRMRALTADFHRASRGRNGWGSAPINEIE